MSDDLVVLDQDEVRNPGWSGGVMEGAKIRYAALNFSRASPRLAYDSHLLSVTQQW